MKLYSIVWWAAAIFWLADGSVAPYSKYIAMTNEGSCKFAVQSFVKKHNIPYSLIPPCRQSTPSTFNLIMDANPTYLPTDGTYERVAYVCLPRRRCKDME